MAVDERIAWVVCSEVYGDGLQRHHVDGVLDEPAEVLILDAGDFEAVAVQVDGVLVAAGVTEDHAIAFAAFDLEGFDVGPCIAVDGPGVELGAVEGARVAEGEGEGLFWVRDGIVGGEASVVPFSGLWVAPYWVA